MKVGFIGLGNVGAKLSGSLLRNGVDLTVFYLNDSVTSEFERRGASLGQSPAQIMQVCDTVFTCPPTPAASESVMFEMLPRVVDGKIWMEMSTADEAEVKRFGAEVTKGGRLRSSAFRTKSTSNVDI